MKLIYQQRRIDITNKFERMKNAFRKMESDLNEYVNATKKFEVSSSSATQKNETAVDVCISSIDDYMSVSI